ncbi:MAG: sigma-70 family RNA polymerase sigma factor [bacterium]|nr:sigma-70 family RNA polymerase sigma factor [bacterium]
MNKMMKREKSLFSRDVMEWQDIIKRIDCKIKCIVRKVEKNGLYFDRDDLYQEILLHLWLDFKEGKLDDKTDSYILQGCYFYIKNYIRKNRERFNIISIEEIRAQHNNWDIPENQMVDDETIIDLIEKSGIFNDRERYIIYLLLEGFTIREIGNKLGVSHVMVIKIKHRLETKLKSYFKDTGVTIAKEFLLV